MPSRNTIQRRSDLLAEAIKTKVGTTYRSLTEPEPAFRVKKPELDQVKDYLTLKQNGGLAALRSSNGGPQDDADVDRYVSHMEPLIAKHAPNLFGAVPMEQEF